MKIKVYGFVDFESKADAEKIFDVYLRSNNCFKLKSRLIKLAQYRQPRRSKDGKQSTKAAHLDSKPNADNNIVQAGTEQGGGSGVECGLTIDDLPNDMLFSIFARLPLENLYALEKGSCIKFIYNSPCNLIIFAFISFASF